MKQTLFLAVFAAVVLFGVYAAVTVYDDRMKLGRMNETPVIRPHEEPFMEMDTKVIAYQKSEELIRRSLGETLPAGRITEDKAFLEKGKADYQAFCSHCHGDRLDGQGTVGQSFHPLPTDLTGEKARKLSDRELFALISYGSKKTPALATTMSVESRLAVIDYIRFRQEKKDLPEN